jgi:Tfp pilus assembly protein PilF
MSLINQMLRDLHRQHGADSGAQFMALWGHGLVAVNGGPRWRNSRRLAWGLLAVAGLALLQAMFSTSSTHTLHTAGSGAQVQLPLALPAEQPRRAALRGADRTPVVAPPTESAGSTAPATGAPQAIAAIEAEPVRKRAVTSVTPAGPTAARILTLTPGQKADRLFGQAQAALAGQDRATAAKLLRQVLAEYPQHGAAREQLAMLMIQDGQRENAEVLLTEGLVVTPKRAELARTCAQLMVERGALLPALHMLEPFTDSPAADAGALALQAAILDRLHRYSEATDAYRRALRLQPRQAVWWTGLGLALEHEGQPAPALAAYRRAAQLPLQDAVKTFVQQRIHALDAPGNRANG